MKNLKVLLLALMIVGILSPYLLIAYKTGYHLGLLSFLATVGELDQPTWMMMLFLFFGGLISRRWFGINNLRGIITVLLAASVTIPSTIMGALVMISIVGGYSQLSDWGVKLYFGGLSTMVVLAPILLGLHQINLMMKGQGSPVAPVGLTLVISGILSLLTLASLLDIPPIRNISGPSYLGLKLFQSLVVLLLGSWEGTLDLGVVARQLMFRGAALPLERPLIGLYFSLASLGYFLLRSNPVSYSPISPEGRRLLRSYPSPLQIGAIILAATIANFSLLMILQAAGIAESLLTWSAVITLFFLLGAMPRHGEKISKYEAT